MEAMDQCHHQQEKSLDVEVHQASLSQVVNVEMAGNTRALQECELGSSVKRLMYSIADASIIVQALLSPFECLPMQGRCGLAACLYTSSQSVCTLANST